MKHHDNLPQNKIDNIKHKQMLPVSKKIKKNIKHKQTNILSFSNKKTEYMQAQR